MIAMPTVCTVRLSRCFVTENLAEWLSAIMRVGLVISSAGTIKMNIPQIVSIIAMPTVCTVRLSRYFVTENLAEWVPAIMRVGLVISSAGKIKMNISQIFFGIISVYDSDANCLYGTFFAMLCNGKPR